MKTNLLNDCNFWNPELKYVREKRNNKFQHKHFFFHACKVFNEEEFLIVYKNKKLLNAFKKAIREIFCKENETILKNKVFLKRASLLKEHFNLDFDFKLYDDTKLKNNRIRYYKKKQKLEDIKKLEKEIKELDDKKKNGFLKDKNDKLVNAFEKVLEEKKEKLRNIK